MDECDLSNWNLPEIVVQNYKNAGLHKMFAWQAECLNLPGVADGKNLVYSAPTSAGKSLVAEILLLKKILKTKKKCVYILPYISLARERMFSIRSIFEVCGVRVDGYMGGVSPTGGFSAVDVAVCTIEKANALINRLIDEKKMAELGMVIVDEIHMVGDSNRGYLIELLLTKIRYINESSKLSAVEGCDISVLGMSATVPNLELLALWLDAAHYQTHFRPVPLQSYIKIGSEIFDENLVKARNINPVIDLSGDEDNIASLCLETLRLNHSVLIFCPTKNWCEKLAKSITNQFSYLQRNSKELGFCVNISSIRDVIAQLRRSPAGLDAVLLDTIPWAVAYHHAGLTTEERDIVETAFRNNVVRVLVATSTLSSGVNLPARRVIIRTPSFNRGLLDVRSYHQMVGRAGRKGIDEAGESILICKPHEKHKGRKLMSSELPPVRSCLVIDPDSRSEMTSAIRRAILEVIVNGLATTQQQVRTYMNCTLLAAQTALSEMEERSGRRSSPNGERVADEVINNCVTWLYEHEFILLRTSADDVSTFTPTKLGKAALMSSLPTSEALRVLADLQVASKALALDNELHLVYQITPIYSLSSNVNWFNYLNLYEKLSPPHRRVADLVGVDEGFVTRLAATGGLRANQRLSEARERQINVHTRFYASLILHDLIQELPLYIVCEKFGENKGMIQSLQQSAATFAGMVTSFCQQLGWWSLEVLLREFQTRLVFGVQRELLDLMQVSLLDSAKARALYNAGLMTCDDIALSKSDEIEQILRNSNRFRSKRDEDVINDMTSVRGIRIPGSSKSVTESEAAYLIRSEARRICGIEDQFSTKNAVKRNSGFRDATEIAIKSKLIDVTNSDFKSKQNSDSSYVVEDNIQINKTDRNKQNKTIFQNDLLILENVKLSRSAADENKSNVSSSSLCHQDGNYCFDTLANGKPTAVDIKAGNSITETQMAAIFEEDFNVENGLNFKPNSTPLNNPVASTPVTGGGSAGANAIPDNTRSRKSSANIGFSSSNPSNLSGDMFDSSSDGRSKKKTSAVNWSTESVFHCSPEFRRGCHDVKTENDCASVPFSNYLKPNQFDSEKSVHSVDEEMFKLSLSDFLSHDSNCTDEIVASHSTELTPAGHSDSISRKIVDLSADESERNRFFNQWKTKTYFSMTMSVQKKEHIFEVAVYWGEKCVYYIGAMNLEAGLEEDRRAAEEVVANIVASMNGFAWSTTVVSFRVKHLLKLLFKIPGFPGWELSWQDPFIAGWLIDPDEEPVYRAVDLLRKYCPEKVEAFRALSGQNHGEICSDALASFFVMQRMREMLKEQQLWHPFIEIEMPHEISMALLEHNGIAIDAVRLTQLFGDLHERKAKLQEEAWRIVGRRFNLASVVELRKIFSELSVVSSSCGKFWSTNKEALTRFHRESNSHPLIPVILDWRSVQYAVACLHQINRSLLMSSSQTKLSTMKRYHPVTQLTSTGKINMKMQFIPKTKQLITDDIDQDKKYSLREFFVAEEGFSLLAADYSQLELRMMAHLSKDEALLQAFKEGRDIFRELAAKFYEKEQCIGAVTEEERRVAKEIVYAMNYGIGNKSLSSKISLSEVEIEAFRTQFFLTYPRLQIFFREVVECCRKQGYVSTLSGRRRHLPDIHHRDSERRCRAERQARNTRVAGSAADLVKAAAVKIDEEMRKRGWNVARKPSGNKARSPKSLTLAKATALRTQKIISLEVAKYCDGDLADDCFLVHQLHDELIYEVKSHLVEQAVLIVDFCMSNPIPVGVPLQVKIKTGPSWENLKDFVTNSRLKYGSQ